MKNVGSSCLNPGEIRVPDDLRRDLVCAESALCRELRGEGSDPEELIDRQLEGYDAAYAFVAPFLDSYSSPRILEIGCGNGLGLCSLLMRGLNAVGVEPGASPGFEGRYHRALRVLEENGFAPAAKYVFPANAESLPFASSSFDVVFSIAVLEHVSDIGACLHETARVLKPGGLALMHVPNYDSFREGHYGSWWLPYVLRRKGPAKWFVRRILRRPDAFVDSLNFTSPRMIGRLRRGFGETLDLRTYAFATSLFTKVTWLEYCLRETLPSRSAFVALVRRRPLLHAAALAVGAVAAKTFLLAGLCPTFTIICRKRGPAPDG